MNDAVIRENFHRKVLRRYHAAHDVLVLDELGLRHGKSRADIALVNGRLIGYEIKSDEDSLDRLEEQVRFYSAVFDRATIIVAGRHVKPVRSLVPEWWGIVVGKPGGETQVSFQTLRRAELNKKVDPYAVAQLLWSVEAATILDELGEPPSVRRQRRSFLYRRLADLLSLPELRRRVTSCLKSRKNWRLRAPLLPGGDLFPPSAK
jgi:hypothetical protein